MAKKSPQKEKPLVLYEAYPYARPIALVVAGLFIAGFSYTGNPPFQIIGLFLGVGCSLFGLIRLFCKSKILCTFLPDQLVFNAANKKFLYAQIAYVAVFYKQTPGAVGTSRKPYFKLQLMFGEKYLFLQDDLSPQDQTVFIEELKKHKVPFKGKQYEKGLFIK